MNDEKGNEFDVNLELNNELKNNPNAEIQSTGKYDCVCSATKTKDMREIIYSWKIGYSTKRILATLLLSGLNNRTDINKRICLAEKFFNGIEIKTHYNNVS